MKRMIIILFLLPTVSTCRDHKNPAIQTGENNAIDHIGDIPTPRGFLRTMADSQSFESWLRTIRLKKNTTVYLYNGEPKEWQGAQFAVIDMPVGTKNLQQCADAIMRLKAEFFYSKGLLGQIIFRNNTGVPLSYSRWLKGERYKISGDNLLAYQTDDSVTGDRKALEDYLESVFMYCGSYDLASELSHTRSISEISPGDVFIKPGSPGHAMIVVDVAENNNGEKMFMLAQSYMPAQDIHIVKNPLNATLSPWYKVSLSENIVTPEWTFRPGQLKGW